MSPEGTIVPGVLTLENLNEQLFLVIVEILTNIRGPYSVQDEILAILNCFHI